MLRLNIELGPPRWGGLRTTHIHCTNGRLHEQTVDTSGSRSLGRFGEIFSTAPGSQTNRRQPLILTKHQTKAMLHTKFTCLFVVLTFRFCWTFSKLLFYSQFSHVFMKQDQEDIYVIFITCIGMAHLSRTQMIRTNRIRDGLNVFHEYFTSTCQDLGVSHSVTALRQLEGEGSIHTHGFRQSILLLH